LQRRENHFLYPKTLWPPFSHFNNILKQTRKASEKDIKLKEFREMIKRSKRKRKKKKHLKTLTIEFD